MEPVNPGRDLSVARRVGLRHVPHDAMAAGTRGPVQGARSSPSRPEPRDEDDPGTGCDRPFEGSAPTFHNQGVHFDRDVIGKFPVAAFGTGPPLVILAGLTPATGVDSSALVKGAMDPVLRLAATRRLIVINRRPGLPRGLTMSSLAAEHARALRSRFDCPVDVLGASTGGSIAQQLAADHPDVVRRLGLVSTACRLSPHGREEQARVARAVRAGQLRRASASAAAALIPAGAGQHLAAAVGWLAARHVITGPVQAEDLATTIEAEDEFDLTRCRDTIQAPTVVVAGARDRFYSRELFVETARLIPNSQLRLVPRRGHITVTFDRRVRAELAKFFADP